MGVSQALTTQTAAVMEQGCCNAVGSAVDYAAANLLVRCCYTMGSVSVITDAGLLHS